MKKHYQKYSPALTLIIGLIVGILLIFKPGAMIDLVVKIIGWGLIAVGAFMAGQKFVEGKKDLQSYVQGALMIVVGILVLLFAKSILKIFPLAIGILLLIAGLYKLKTAFELRKSSGNKWIYMAAIAAASIIFAIIMIVRPTNVSDLALRIIGIFIVIECAEDLFALKIL